VGRPAEEVRRRLYGQQEAEEMGEARCLEANHERTPGRRVRQREGEAGRALHRQQHHQGQERGELIGYDGHKHIKGSKIHAVTTKDSLPVAVELGPGNQHEGRKLIPVMESISIKHGRGRPRKRPKVLFPDTNYNMPLNRFWLDKRNIRSQMPEHPGKRKRSGRPRVFDKSAYNHVRSMIERFNGWIKAFRRVATRFDRLPQVYMGFVHLACIMVYLRVLQ
jgi:transposase